MARRPVVERFVRGALPVDRRALFITGDDGERRGGKGRVERPPADGMECCQFGITAQVAAAEHEHAGGKARIEIETAVDDDQRREAGDLAVGGGETGGAQ